MGWSASLAAAALCAGFASVQAHGAAAPPVSTEGIRFFEEQVRPLLARRCYTCHSGKASPIQGSLRLDLPAGWLRSGASGPSVVPGKPDDSLLIRAVRYQGTVQMPPSGKLPAAEIAVLEQWVRMGAPAPAKVQSPKSKVQSAPSGGQASEGSVRPSSFALRPSHWALQPIRRPSLPEVRDAAWCRTPVDRFILARLERAGLHPSSLADPRTLIRRVTFDLTGLPPTPEEVEAFVRESALEKNGGLGERANGGAGSPIPPFSHSPSRKPDAYARLIDRLLASPSYGERWGRHWLDVVHYGDTHGYDKDKRRDHAWPYRDYVIRSFNQDKPYAQFVREQIAGDVLPGAGSDGVIATGFIAAGPWDFVGQLELREGTVEKEKTRVLDRDDMVFNTMSTFTSLTVGCARCHNHKFDPIPQKEYYGLQAVFSGVDRGDRPFYDAQTGARKAELDRRRETLLAERTAFQAKVAALTSPELAALDREIGGLRSQAAALPTPTGAPGSPSNGYHSAIEAKPDVEKWVQVDLGAAVPIDEVRLIPARPTDFPDTPGFGFPARFRIAVSDTADFARQEVIDDHAAADFANPADRLYRVTAGARRARYVRVTALRLWPRKNDYVFALGELQVLSGGCNIAAGAKVTALDSIQAGRWSRAFLVDGFDSRSRLSDLSDPAAAALVRRSAELDRKLAEAERARRAAVDALVDPRTRQALTANAAGLAEAEEAIRKLPSPQQVYAVLPHAPRPIRVLTRGDVEQPADAAPPGALSCVGGRSPEFHLPAPQDEGARRLALAEWIADPKNPLTWRSIANRVWQYHFGKGLVDTPNDFGRNGNLPSHPELLDYLASELLANGGRLKALHRMILLSAAYQQSSKVQSPKPKVQMGRSSGGLVSGGLVSGRRPSGRLVRTPNTERRTPKPQRLNPERSPTAGARTPERLNADPQSVDSDNRLLWRMNRQRLEAEEIRDSVLAVSGKLDRTMGGPGFELFRFKDDHSPVYDHTAIDKINDPATWRRTVYRFTVRSVPNPFLECMDGADPNLNTPVRSTTVTALQALALLNDPFIVKQSECFAERLTREATGTGAQIERAYFLALGRRPALQEKAALGEYAAKYGLANACRVLLNSNEFVFVD